MADDFRKICEDFNASARDLPRSGKSSDIMLTRYALLLKHKAETEEEKAALVSTLYDCGMNLLKCYTGPNASTYIRDSAPTNIETIFSTLRRPESLKYIPEKSAGELADVALALLAKADNANENQFTSSNRYDGYIRSMVTFSRTALQTADACRAAIDEREIDIKTGKSITPAKRIILKQPESGGKP